MYKPSSGNLTILLAPKFALSDTAKCCRLKADACEVYVADRKASGPLTIPSDTQAELDFQAAEHDWYLWMFDRSRGHLNFENLLLIAQLYRCLDDSVSLLRQYVEVTAEIDPHDVDTCPPMELMNGILEAVSDVQAHFCLALRLIGLVDGDRDLRHFHRWLNEELNRRNIESPTADEVESPEAKDIDLLLQRIKELRKQLEEFHREQSEPTMSMLKRRRRRRQ